MKVTSDQALAWRMRRQFLERRGDAGAGEVISRLCGVQAQVASAAETAVGIRQAEPNPDGVRRGLSNGSLVKTWAMRGTLHLMRSDEAANYLSLLAAARTWTKPSWSRAFGADPREVEQLAEAVAGLLDGRSLTRDELVSELVADARFTGMEEHLRSGWGALLKPLAWQGVMCHGPSRGNKVTFSAPKDCVPGWRGLPEPDEAAPEAIAAYLGAFGPATPEGFDAWLSRNSLRKTLVRGWFKDMGDRLAEVDLDGGSAYVLAEHADELAAVEPSRTVRLVGQFDQYVLGPGTKETRMLPAHHRAKVSKAAGWISAVVLLGGRIVGVWEESDGSIAVTLFADAERPDTEALEGEAAHLAKVRGLDGFTVRVS
jgi:hypothetical protein